MGILKGDLNKMVGWGDQEQGITSQPAPLKKIITNKSELLKVVTENRIKKQKKFIRLPVMKNSSFISKYRRKKGLKENNSH